MRQKVYIETSVISYLAALPSRDLVMAANQKLTHEWWNDHTSKFLLLTSQLVIDEASAGDKSAAKKRIGLLTPLQLIEQTEEAVELATHLLRQGAMPKKAAADALHVAIATVGGADFLLTWNCRHINNVRMRGTIEEACRDFGLEPAAICSPQDLLESFQ